MKCNKLRLKFIATFEKLKEYYIIKKYYRPMLFYMYISLKMNIGILFLKSNLTGIITFSELDWITTHQSNFTRLEESIAIKLGRMLDAGSTNIGCRLNS